MGWIYITHMETKDGRLGFCTNPWIPDPTQDYTRGGSATNPTQAEFNAAMLVDDSAINLYTMDSGTHRWELDDTYYLDLTHNGNTTSVSSNLPNFYGFNTAGVINRRYLNLFIDKENQLATWGWITYNDPANYTSSYKVCFVPYSDTKAHTMYLAIKGLLPKDTPYYAGGISTSGGGDDSTFDLASDSIAIPTLQSLSASGAGFLSLYQVSLQNMKDFASYLWSPLFDVNTLKKLFTDPMEAIISLGMLPFTPTGGTPKNIYIGESDTGVSASLLSDQYHELSMGSVTLDKFYDSALDLNPYTKVELYLPYCGTVSLNPDEFHGLDIDVTYHVDVLSGACTAFVSDGTRVLVQTQGNVLTPIPFSETSFKQFFGAVMTDVAMAGAALFAAPSGGLSLVAATGVVGAMAINTMNSKFNTPHGGQCASTAGFLSIQKPYLIITRPAQCLPDGLETFQGFPAYVTETIENITGFFKVYEAHFDGFSCTEGELKEVERLLKEGVYK